MDGYLEAVTELSGQHFKFDNKRVWKDLKPLVTYVPGWSLIKVHEKSKDGRQEILSLIRKNQGINTSP